MHVNKIILKYIILFFPLLEPEYFKHIHNINLIYRMWYYLAIGYMVFDLFDIENKRVRYSKKTIIYIGFIWGAYIICTLMNKGDIPLYRYLIKRSALVGIECTYIQIKIKDDSKRFCHAVMLLLNMTSILNLLSIILFKDGLYVTSRTRNAAYLLGHKNTMIYVPLLAIIFTVLDDLHTTNGVTYKSYLMSLVALLSVLWGKADGGIMACGILVIFVVLIKMNLEGLVPSSTKMIMGISFISILMVVFNVQEHFSNVLFWLFGKDSTLSTRTLIWERALRYFKDSPWFGVGFEFSTTIAKQIILRGTHNFILGIMFHTGILGLVAWCFVWWYLRNNSKNGVRHKEIKIVEYGIVAMMILGIVENIAAEGTIWYLMFIFAVLLGISDEKKGC